MTTLCVIDHTSLEVMIISLIEVLLCGFEINNALGKNGVIYKNDIKLFSVPNL